MAEEIFVDVQYQGIELGRGLGVTNFCSKSAYLFHSEPMPVGTTLILVDKEIEVSVKVSRVFEQVAGLEKPPGVSLAFEAKENQEAAMQWWTRQVKRFAKEGDAVPPESKAAKNDKPPAKKKAKAKAKVKVSDETAAPKKQKKRRKSKKKSE